MKAVAVIMAGGRGERFWPYSRVTTPKQVLPITSNKPLIVETVERLEDLFEPSDIYISTGKDLYDPLKTVLPQVKFILEPIGRDTAACIGYSAKKIMSEYTDAIMVIIGSDYFIKKPEKYRSTLIDAITVAEHDMICTIGVKPTYPATGYGYLNLGESLGFEVTTPVYRVRKFEEKPPLEKAKDYIEQGMLWNSGMFIAKASVLIKEIERYLPKLANGLNRMKDANFEESEVLRQFESFEKISIDFGIMEKTEKIVAIPGDFGWDDVGNWAAMERIFDKDPSGNIAQGKGSLISVRNNNCIFFSQEGRLIAAMGLDDIVVVDIGNAILVCSKDEAQNVKQIYKELTSNEKYQPFQ